MGWYHNHQGYGCWLSGVDGQTELLNREESDPYCALVIDSSRAATTAAAIKWRWLYSEIPNGDAAAPIKVDKDRQRKKFVIMPSMKEVIDAAVVHNMTAQNEEDRSRQENWQIRWQLLMCSVPFARCGWKGQWCLNVPSSLHQTEMRFCHCFQRLLLSRC